MNSRAILPLLILIGASVATGLIVFIISRVLLSFSKTTTPPVALAIAMAVLLICAVVAGRVQATPR